MSELAHLERQPRPTRLFADVGGAATTSSAPDAVAAAGRQSELQILETLFSFRAGRGGCAVIRGEPGIGKSYLLDAAAAIATSQGGQILRVTGVECETHLVFAGLHQLLRPLIGQIAELPIPQKQAAEAALGLAAGPVPELFLLGLAALTLFADAAGRAPVTIIVDDAHWVDEPTLEVLAFVARRLESDRVVLLAAQRYGSATPLDTAQLPSLELTSLDRERARALLESRYPDLAPSTVERVLGLSEGNPLALLELPLALAQKPTEARSESDSIKLTSRLKQTFASRVDELPKDAGLMLLVASVNDSESLSETLKASAVLLGEQPSVAALTPAETARLVELDGVSLRFRHPLIRAAIRQRATAAELRRAHGALAEVLDADLDRRAWHLAASATGPDEAIARELERAAQRAAQRGALRITAGALERAAYMSEDKVRRGQRMIQAAEAALEVAGPDLVERLAAEADTLELGLVDLGRLTLIRTLIGTSADGEPPALLSLVRTAERLAEPGEQRLALRILWAAATSAFHADSDPETGARIATACRSLRVPEDDPELLSALALAAPISNAEVVIERCLAWTPQTSEEESDGAAAVGTALCTVGGAVFAHGFLTVAGEHMREAGRARPLARVLALRAMADFVLGFWPASEVDGAEAARLAMETNQPVWASTALTAQAMLAAARGESQADSLANEAERLALPVRARAPLAMVQMARGLTALSSGAHETAFQELRRMFDTADLSFHSAKCGRAASLFAEAAVQSGHQDEARALLQARFLLTPGSASPWQAVSVRHAAALVADDTDCEELFSEALAADLTRWPFERARLQLAYGAWLRRQRRAADSRAPLRAAGDTFGALGATPWTERAYQELRASGEHSRRRVASTRDDLTPQELQIAAMAASGLSNREIGEKLYLSHRTVASHLYRVFPKLGVTSRAELAAALAEEEGQSSSKQLV